MTAEAVVRCGDQVRTHGEVRGRAARIASALATLGVGHGDLYALVMRNEIGFVEVILRWSGDRCRSGPGELARQHRGPRPPARRQRQQGRRRAHRPDSAGGVRAAGRHGDHRGPGPPVVADAYGLTHPEPSAQYPNLDELVTAANRTRPSSPTRR
ncbi:MULTISPECIES: hypothetical protein [unclassified Rhodococcus (in: high G+C Gram-positive bacteria)]|uniref:hypothetical protein n=1 Tax=unclassified Rhodococcus (in: high G+C Gram-positive bacteria) TaxID=192944 RepID=UPI001BB3E6A3|nr:MULTISPECIES: hypothetical protein [unclassified Rhodococcus (in: high G+C Gram-positive bacteria)]